MTNQEMNGLYDAFLSLRNYYKNRGEDDCYIQAYDKLHGVDCVITSLCDLTDDETIYIEYPNDPWRDDHWEYFVNVQIRNKKRKSLY